MPDPNKKLINVVCVILENTDGQIFVARRPEGKALAGGWEFPGGKIEAGETHKRALEREIQEELEINIEVGEEGGKLLLVESKHEISACFTKLVFVKSLGVIIIHNLELSLETNETSRSSLGELLLHYFS